MTPLNIFHRHYAQRWDAQRVTEGWDRSGHRIVGYTDVNCPEEIIMAAGCLPLLMTGRPDTGLPTAGHRVDRGSSLPVRYFYEAVLSGRYDFVDLIVTMGGDRWIANVHGFLEEERRVAQGNVPFGASYFLERLRTRFKQHRDFNLGRLNDFRSYLAHWLGRPITTAALAEAIGVTNESRRLLRELSDRRKAPEPWLSGRDALAIYSASMLMPKARFNTLMRDFLAGSRPPASTAGKARLYMSGSIVDHLGLYELVESLPAVIVGEDTALGERYALEPVSTVLEPMDALADRYTYKPLDPWMLGMDERIRFRVDAAKAARAQGVIFFHQQNDDPVGWDYPDQKRALEAQGIPVLTLFDQDYELRDGERVRAAIAEFIQQLPPAKDLA